MKAHTNRQAFTLVELVVVVAIISVLAAMLLPTLRGALESSRDVFCKNKLKQFYNASLFYSDDWNGVVPNARNYGIYHWAIMADYFDYRTGPNPYDIDNNKRYQFYNCPSENQQPDYYPSFGLVEYGPNIEMGDCDPHKYAGHEYPYRLSKVRYATKVLYWGENAWYMGVRPKGTGYVGLACQFRHNLKGNGAMFDGHVEGRYSWYENGYGKVPHGDNLP